MDYGVLKSLHIIFVVTWFAGLFYMPRILIYQAEAQDRPDPEKDILTKEYKRNARRLWLGITWPSAIITLIMGTWLLIRSGYITQGFMHVKLGLVVLLYVYHIITHIIYRQQQNDVYKWNSMRLRMWNEVATLFLVAIVFIIVLKNAISWIYFLLGFVALILALVMAIRVYKNLRMRNKK